MYNIKICGIKFRVNFSHKNVTLIRTTMLVFLIINLQFKGLERNWGKNVNEKNEHYLKVNFFLTLQIKIMYILIKISSIFYLPFLHLMIEKLNICIHLRLLKFLEHSFCFKTH